MDTETLIKVEGVSKKFCRNLKKSLWYGMQDLGNEILGRPHGEKGELRANEFWAVNDVSFKLKRGECLGLIGRNGAGKTTLLRMLNGLIKPDSGKIAIRGRVGALIALGAGFNPILTGRENIYANAAVLGLSKREIEEKFDEIIDFADLGDFIDTPVQSYSSGMAVRLGFSIATSMEPDILLLDEVLAVGDEYFQSKCFKRIKSVINNGGAILLVSHTNEHIAHHCTRAILLKKGKIHIDSSPSAALNAYINNYTYNKDINRNIKNFEISKNEIDQYEKNFFYNANEVRWGDRSAEIKKIKILQNNEECINFITPYISTDIVLSILFYKSILNPIIGISIKNKYDETIFETNSKKIHGSSYLKKILINKVLNICFNFTPILDEDIYYLSIGVASETMAGIQAHDRRYNSLVIKINKPKAENMIHAMNPSFSILTD